MGGSSCPSQGNCCPWGLGGFAAARGMRVESSLPAFAPSRATLAPLVLPVLLEKMAPKELEETAAPPAEPVTPASKVPPEPLARRESPEMTVPLYVPPGQASALRAGAGGGGAGVRGGQQGWGEGSRGGGGQQSFVGWRAGRGAEQRPHFQGRRSAAPCRAGSQLAGWPAALCPSSRSHLSPFLLGSRWSSRPPGSGWSEGHCGSARTAW